MTLREDVGLFRNGLFGVFAAAAAPGSLGYISGEFQTVFTAAAVGAPLVAAGYALAIKDMLRIMENYEPSGSPRDQSRDDASQH